MNDELTECLITFVTGIDDPLLSFIRRAEDDIISSIESSGIHCAECIAYPSELKRLAEVKELMMAEQGEFEEIDDGLLKRLVTIVRDKVL